MATSAPAASALARSPEYLMPPSAITGVPDFFAASTASMMAVSCGTPTPATMRVVQIEPGPMPTLMASAPASISACAPSAVAILPATTCTALEARLMRVTASSTCREWPCAVSTTIEVDAGLEQALGARRSRLSPTVVAAATRSRPCSSLQAFGLVTAFSMSFTVIRPTQRYCASTTRSFSMRCWCSSRLASSWPTPSRTVTSLSLVISSATVWRGSAAKRTSRLVRMPTSLPGTCLWPLPPPSTTGMPEMLFSFISASASASVASGWMVSGFTTMPDSNFLTWRTCAACWCGLEVAVDDADAAGLRHGDRHLGLRSPCPWRRRPPAD